MIKYFKIFTAIFLITACAKSPEIQTSEIEAIELIKDAFLNFNKKKVSVDSRKLLSRDHIDKVGIPILFVELENGQNGTLTKYPGQGIGQTWLGADGATLTLRQGVLLASRGMGDDLMGGSSYIPPWSQIVDSPKYKRSLSYLGGDNQIYTKFFDCTLDKGDDQIVLNIWEASFIVTLFREHCVGIDGVISNQYFIDNIGVVRRSVQYHSETIGYVITERLDR